MLILCRLNAGCKAPSPIDFRFHHYPFVHICICALLSFQWNQITLSVHETSSLRFAPAVTSAAWLGSLYHQWSPEIFAAKRSWRCARARRAGPSTQKPLRGFEFSWPNGKPGGFGTLCAFFLMHHIHDSYDPSPKVQRLQSWALRVWCVAQRYQENVEHVTNNFMGFGTQTLLFVFEESADAFKRAFICSDMKTSAYIRPNHKCTGAPCFGKQRVRCEGHHWHDASASLSTTPRKVGLGKAEQASRIAPSCQTTYTHRGCPEVSNASTS